MTKPTPSSRTAISNPFRARGTAAIASHRPPTCDGAAPFTQPHACHCFRTAISEIALPATPDPPDSRRFPGAAAMGCRNQGCGRRRCREGELAKSWLLSTCTWAASHA